MTEKKISYCGNQTNCLLRQQRRGEPYLIHNYDGAVEFPPVAQCFILPLKGQGEYRSYEAEIERAFFIRISADEMEVTVSAGEGGAFSEPVWKEFDGPPCCDVMGNTMELDFENGGIFLDTYYHFYWETLLPSVVERTRAKSYSDSDGYVVSTLPERRLRGDLPGCRP